jgi:DNA mismatch repair protein MutL
VVAGHDERSGGSWVFDAGASFTVGAGLMGRIARLSPELANQIAAGEVVERPASVVKELAENAIDAGARRIAIEIELGGKRLIRVEDDGAGMSPEDAELALERHATSKISRAEDLAAITTMGFRGEALPSIASVSRLTLRTRARGTLAGTEIRVNGGVTSGIREVGAPEGTLVEVAELFYNLPARRKFLKSDSAESAQVSRLVTQLALGYPEIGFSLVSAGRKVLQAPPAAGARERFFQIYGERHDLVELRRQLGGFSVVGFVAALGDQGPVRGPQNVFVNRRVVKDRTIAHAVTAAYSVATIKERSPEVHLFIEIPPERVDVNVHPTKAEVRFLDQSFVHEALRRAIGDALGQGPAPGLQFRLGAEAVPPAGPSNVGLPGVFAGATFGARWSPAPGAPAPAGGAGVAPGTPPAERAGWHAPPTERADGGVVAPAQGQVDRQAAVDAVRPMVPLGQFRDTYIIAIDDEGIAIVDQHVAHERVLFEQIGERLAAGRLPSQRLLQPLVLELSPAQREALAGRAADLDRLGFEIEDFGGGSVRVSAVPSLVGLEEAAGAVRALAEDLEGFDRGASVDEALRRIAATMACHAAVKANQPLSVEKMTYILQELRRTAYSSVCPHGRPVVLRLSRREIEKNFQRI